MADLIKETENTQTVHTKGNREVAGSQTMGYLVYFLFSLIEIILGFRFVLKLLGANPLSGFVNFIYDVSQIFIIPFQGIFRRGVTEGVETTSVLEPETLIAMVVYAVLAWGIVKLVLIISGQKPEDE